MEFIIGPDPLAKPPYAAGRGPGSETVVKSPVGAITVRAIPVIMWAITIPAIPMISPVWAVAMPTISAISPVGAIAITISPIWAVAIEAITVWSPIIGTIAVIIGTIAGIGVCSPIGRVAICSVGRVAICSVGGVAICSVVRNSEAIAESGCAARNGYSCGSHESEE